MFDLTHICDSLFTTTITFAAIILLFYFIKRATDFILDGEEKSDGYVLVTGCDTGFGYNLAFELNKRNMYVFAGCLTHDGVTRFNDDDNFNGVAIAMDVCNIEDVENARTIIAEEVKEKGLWCVVNNAGVNQLGPFEWLSVQQMRAVLDVNLWGMVNVTKAMLPLVKKARGRVVNMSSILGRVCSAYVAPYCMSKYAVEAFSDSLRYEMKPWGVSVHIIEPGSHSTEFLDGHERLWDELWNAQSKQTQEDYGEHFRKDLVVKMQRKARQMSSDPQAVVNAYRHAVLSPRPKSRYVVGLDANTIGLVLATLPTAIGDFLREMLVTSVIPAATKKVK